MENQEKLRGRPKIYNQDQLREHRTRYMLNKDWYCEICHRRYSLAGKFSHLGTIKHMNNYIKTIHEM